MDMSFGGEFLNLKKNNSLKAYGSKINDIYSDFENFYFSSSYEIQAIVSQQVALLSPEAILNEINNLSVNSKITIPDDMKETILKRFYDHYVQIKDILNKELRR